MDTPKNTDNAGTARRVTREWLVNGYGYDITSTDVRAAYLHTLTAATNAGIRPAVRTRIRALFDKAVARSGFVASIIGKDVGID